jgi:hypothetical protein
MGDPLLVPLRAELTQRVPHARQVPAAGTPLDGAVRIAVDLAGDRLTLPRDEHMLYVMTEKGTTSPSVLRKGDSSTLSDK